MGGLILTRFLLFSSFMNALMGAFVAFAVAYGIFQASGKATVWALFVAVLGIASLIFAWVLWNDWSAVAACADNK